MGRLPLPQDHRRLRLHLPVHRAPVAPRLRSLCRLRHRGALPRSFLGKPGRGKTHLAVAIAYRAIQNGFDALFTTAAELIDDLSAAFREGRLAEALTTYTHPAVLVVDEVGYLTYGTDAANMLFHVVNERHRRKRSMIFTTNKPLAAWGKVLHDEDLAQAIVDRVLERGRLLTLDGPSMRTRHLGLDDLSLGASNHGADNLARISGIPRPEFPEPTLRAPNTLIARLSSLCSAAACMPSRGAPIADEPEAYWPDTMYLNHCVGFGSNEMGGAGRNEYE